jgi:hypothetical protein
MLGCGADFVEPHPPDLARTTTEYVASSMPEPLVWFVVADLFLENPADCPAALDFLEASVTAAMPKVPLFAHVGSISLSDCTQPASRTFDPAVIDDAVHLAERAFAPHAVRAVLLYANNLAIAPPPQVTDAILTARARIRARSGLTPAIWVSLAGTAKGGALPADHSVPWSFVGDPAYARALGDSLRMALPFVSDVIDTGPHALLGGADAVRARKFKVCGSDANIAGVGFAADGSPVDLDPSRPPQYVVALSARRALEQSAFQPLRVHVASEVCTDHCDRLFHYSPGGDPVRWDASRGCLSEPSR